MGDFYLIIVMIAVYGFLRKFDMSNEKKQLRKVKKRGALRRRFGIPNLTNWFRGAWVVLRKRIKREFVIQPFSFN
jgi:hypothetical protein